MAKKKSVVFFFPKFCHILGFEDFSGGWGEGKWEIEKKIAKYFGENFK